MKTLRLTFLAAVTAFGLTAHADGLYDITFSDGGGNVGFGQIDIEGGFAVGGYFNVTAGVALGSYSLYTAGGSVAYPGFLGSPASKFNYDNAAYLVPIPEFPTTFLDNYGLLFTDVSANELNLWGNADGTYSLYGYINGNAYDPQAVGVSTITPAPEPVNLVTIGLLLIPAGALLRLKSKIQK